jgi:protease YdgD
MRLVAAAATICACLIVSFAVGPNLHSAPTRAYPHRLVDPHKADSGGKPVGSDTCRWANDHECDEPDIGTGACPMGTDYSDCIHLRTAEDDSCQYHGDGECDEPNFGTGACTQGTDHTDCGNIAWMRNQTDSCDFAFNGVCDEPGGPGNGRCRARTDRSDCHGRDRPMSINDHFFGHRVLVPVNDAPWRFIGELVMDTGEACTATLIARDVIVTAAHCINGDNGVNAASEFRAASGGLTARVTAYLLDPRYDYRRFTTTNDIDGLDWALLRLDRPLGDQLGFAGVQNLTGRGSAAARAANLMQAGFAWDTGTHLSGNLRCHIVTVHADNTFAHECDTTRGDSGSSFFVRDGQGYDVIGVDSNFRSNHGGPFIYIAVSAAGFGPHVPDFVAHRSGIRIDSKPK